MKKADFLHLKRSVILRREEQLCCYIIRCFVYIGIENIELMFKRRKGKPTMNWILQFSLIEMKRLMSGVTFDGVRIGDREIHSNTVNPRGCIRSSSNHLTLLHIHHSLMVLHHCSHTSASLVLKLSLIALALAIPSVLRAPPTPFNAASFSPISAQVSHSQWGLPGPPIYKIATFHLPFFLLSFYA